MTYLQGDLKLLAFYLFEYHDYVDILSLRSTSEKLHWTMRLEIIAYEKQPRD